MKVARRRVKIPCQNKMPHKMPTRKNFPAGRQSRVPPLAEINADVKMYEQGQLIFLPFRLAKSLQPAVLEIASKGRAEPDFHPSSSLLF